MRKIDNTAKRYPQGHPAWVLGEGYSSQIEAMEAEGQQQLVQSDRLPTKFSSGTKEEFEALGFTFGDPDPGDPMFCPATLPEGWRREGSSHAMWSYIVDQHGRQRVAIFYKAAYYDRDAFMNLIGVGRYVTEHVEYGEPLIITDEWATPETVAEALASARDSELEEAAQFRGFTQDGGRDEGNRARCGEIADRHEATAEKYAAKLAELTAGG